MRNQDHIIAIGMSLGLLMSWPVASSGAPAVDANDAGNGYQALYSFGKQMTDGRTPVDDLVRAPDGYLYGVTYAGGTGTCGFPKAKCGTVFRLLPHDQDQTVVDFPFTDPITGNLLYAPDSSLTVSPAGTLVGTLGATQGGVYAIGREGDASVLHAFDGADGSRLSAKVAFAPDGSLYGATISGGQFGHGTIFRIDPQGNFSVVYNLGQGPADPIDIFWGLTLGPDGNFYGASGSQLNATGVGTIFRLTPGGQVTVLHTFHRGGGPIGRLALGPDGMLYGFTLQANHGANSAIFRLSTGGKFSVVAENTPANPIAGPVVSADGSIYGTAAPAYGCGVVFKYRQGVSTVTHSFPCAGSTDGSYPSGGLWLDPDGYLYGTTSSGGTYGYGTVYRIGR